MEFLHSERMHAALLRCVGVTTSFISLALEKLVTYTGRR